MKHSTLASLFMVLVLAIEPAFSLSLRNEYSRKEDSNQLEELSDNLDAKVFDNIKSEQIEKLVRVLGDKQKKKKKKKKQWKRFSLFAEIFNDHEGDIEGLGVSYNDQCFQHPMLTGLASANWKGSCVPLPCKDPRCNVDTTPFNCYATFEFKDGEIMVQYLWQQKVYQGSKYWFAITGGTGGFVGATGAVKTIVMDDTRLDPGPDNIGVMDALVKLDFYVLLP